jgi:putative oxidoreductase
MPDLESFLSRWSPRMLSVMRIVVGLIFMQHGAQKLFGFLAAPGMETAPLFSLMGLAGVLEFFGGLLIVLGLFTRITAFILSGLMAVAYFMAHAPKGFWPIQNKGDLAVVLSFLFLYLAFSGGGEWGLDRVWRCKKSAP